MPPQLQRHRQQSQLLQRQFQPLPHLLLPRLRMAPRVLVLQALVGLRELAVLALEVDVVASAKVVLEVVSVALLAWAEVVVAMPRARSPRLSAWRGKRLFFSSQTTQSWTCSAFMRCSLA